MHIWKSIRSRYDWPWLVGLVSVAAALAVFTVLDHALIQAGKGWLLGEELNRLQLFLTGESVNPWQYRLLSNYLVTLTLELAKWLHVPAPEVKAFIVFRGLQNITIFLLAAAYWRRLGIGKLHVISGLAVAAWMFQNSNYHSGLSFSTWSDIIFYLLAALLILGKKYLWLIPLIALAALNRESSGLIPVMAVASVFPPNWEVAEEREAVVSAAVGLIAYAIVFVGVRMVYGPIPIRGAFGHQAGLDLLVYSLGDRQHLVLLFAGLSIFPLLALVYWRRWPTSLKQFFWAIVPIWIVVNALFAFLPEVRVLMVPMVIVFLPAALYAVQGEGAPKTADA
jgi:hypothetical protein